MLISIAHSSIFIPYDHGPFTCQVKVRGQRVELEEVETALKSCPGIAEAAVLLADDRDEAVLVAFLSHKVLRCW